MTISALLSFAVLLVVLLWGFLSLQSGLRRSAEAVLRDLDAPASAEGASAEEPLPGRLTVHGERMTLHDDLGRAGLLTAAERSRFEASGKLVVVAVGCLAVLLRILSAPNGDLAGHLMVPLMAISLAYLWSRGRIARLRERYRRRIEFFLPIVMERLVMAVQSGRDIISAIQSVVELQGETPVAKWDPVTRLLSIVVSLTEAGQRFDTALQEVARAADCSALRHAFIHLGVAYQEGGELVMPLKELSDATQLYYQESVDEQIAKLPVKATAPLLVTFAGLLLCFMTVPMIQVMSFSKDAMEEMNMGPSGEAAPHGFRQGAP